MPASLSWLAIEPNFFGISRCVALDAFSRHVSLPMPGVWAFVALFPQQSKAGEPATCGWCAAFVMFTDDLTLPVGLARLVFVHSYHRDIRWLTQGKQNSTVGCFFPVWRNGS